MKSCKSIAISSSPKLLLFTIEPPAPDMAALILFASFYLSAIYSLIPIEV
jgi:hypothetical protein